MKKALISALLVHLFSASSFASPLPEIQKALTKLFNNERTASATDLLYEFIVHGIPRDNILGLQRFLLNKDLSPHTRYCMRELIDSLEQLRGYNADWLVAALKNMTDDLQLLAQRNPLFPRLLEIAGFSRLEVDSIFCMSFGKSPQFDILRFREFRTPASTELPHVKRIQMYFHSGEYLVTLEPPIVGLPPKAYRGVLIFDPETTAVVQRIPLDRALKLNEEFAVQTSRLMIRMSPEVAEESFQRACPLARTCEIAPHSDHPIIHLGNDISNYGSLKLTKGVQKVVEGNIQIIQVDLENFGRFFVQLKYDEKTKLFNFYQLTVSYETQKGWVSRSSHWQELASVIQNSIAIEEMRKFLVAQRYSRKFVRPLSSKIN
ncbi:MAG: hypothetical protein HYS98_06375 [Deltaproteobacteria bacterium]|nr:hypothetical protein [Deltaproteobacteria bacterium]